MIRNVLTFLIILSGILQLSGQTSIFNDSGESYNGTSGRTEDFYGPIDISNCSSITFTMDFEFTLPWEGSGNMESSDECAFGDPCMPDPNNPLNGDCEFCWDFLYVRILLDGTEIYTELIGDSGTTNSDQSGTISLPAQCLTNESELEIEVFTQTWAGDEGITFSDLEVLCWGGTPNVVANPNPICEDDDLQLNETSGNFTSWMWTGPNGFTSSQQNPTISDVSLADEGVYEVTVEDANNCSSTGSVDVEVTEFPTLPSIGPFCELDDPQSLPNPINGINGTWSGPGLNGDVIDPGDLGPGTFSYTFTEETGQCSESISITIETEENLSLPTDPGPFCETDPVYDLPNPVNGVNGTWSGPGVSGDSFDPSTSGTGTIQLEFSPDPSVCASDLITIVEVYEEPSANAAGPLDVCDDGSGVDLTQLNSTITGGNGGLNVSWYEDMSLSTPINNPSSYNPGPTTVYATVSNSNCESSPISVDINLTPQPDIFPIDPIEPCGDINGNTTIDLTQYDDDINGNSGNTVEWYNDVGLNDQIINPSSFSVNGSITIYAIVTTSNDCNSETEQLSIDVIPAPMGNSVTLTVCSSGSTVEYDLTSVEDDISVDGIDFSWYEDPDTTTEILNPSSYNTTPPTTVYAVFTDECRSEPVEVALEVEDEVNLGNLNDIEVCNGEVLLLDGPSINGMQYEWSGPNGFQSSMEDAIVTSNAQLSDSGIYTLIGTIGNCADTAELIVTVFDEVEATIEINDSIDCNGGNNAEIEAIYSGDSNPVDFDWSDNTYDGNQVLTGVSAGNYEVTITDNNGCTASANIIVSEPAPLIFECDLISGVSGPGASDAVVEVEVGGGTPPYQLVWSGDASGMMNINTAGTYNINDLPEGTVNFELTDDNGCVLNCTQIIPQADCDLNAVISQTDSIDCAGDSTAAIDLNISGGTSPIDYNWNDDTYNGLDRLLNVSAGNYSVTITDDSGCQLVENITIQEPSPLIIDCGQIEPESSMGAEDGIGYITFSGGIQGYEIEWSGPENGNTNSTQADSLGIENLLSGDYQLTVTDNNGCVETCTFQIEEESIACDLNIDIQQIDSILCNGDSTASIEVSVFNGMTPYDYNWSDSDIGNINDPEMLSAGTYDVTVEDADGCTADTSIIILQPPAITVNCIIIEAPLNSSSNDGEVEISFNGDPSEYDIIMEGAAEDTFEDVDSPYSITDLGVGSYSFAVVDSNGCSAECSVLLNASDCDLSLSLSQEDTIQCYGDKSASIISSVTNATGVVQFNWNIDSLDGMNNPDNLGPGTFILTITDGDNCVATDTIVITQPEPLVINCDPIDDSSVEITLDGGTAGYNYVLNGPISQAGTFNIPGSYTLSNLDTGSYSIELTDENGCVDSCFFNLTVPPCNLDLDNTTSPITCNGADDGEIVLDISGINGMATIDWDTPSFDGLDSISNLEPGTYSVTVSDGPNCIDSLEVILIEPDELEVDIQGDTQFCENSTTELSVTDTFATYTWNGQSGNSTYEVSSEGDVIVEISNSNGCTAFDTVMVTRADTVLSYYRDTLCAQDELTINGTVYNIDNPDGAEVFPAASPEGCDSTLIVDLEFLGEIEIEEIDPNCEGVSETQVKILNSGNTALPYDIYYDGTFYETVNSLPYTFPTPGDGTYQLEIVDAQGCVFNTTITSESKETIDVQIYGDSSVIKGDTVVLEADISGPYQSFEWQPPGIVSCDSCLITSAVIENNTIFYLEVIDSFGCLIRVEKPISVSEGLNVYIPNAFSPNLDGVNESFKAYLGPEVQGLKELEIFDRWGNRLYSESYENSTKNIIGWDGKYRSKRLNPDVFMYKIVIELRENQFKTYTGTLTLLK